MNNTQERKEPSQLEASLLELLKPQIQQMIEAKFATIETAPARKKIRSDKVREILGISGATLTSYVKKGALEKLPFNMYWEDEVMAMKKIK